MCAGVGFVCCGWVWVAACVGAGAKKNGGKSDIQEPKKKEREKAKAIEQTTTTATTTLFIVVFVIVASKTKMQNPNQKADDGDAHFSIALLVVVVAGCLLVCFSFSFSFFFVLLVVELLSNVQKQAGKQRAKVVFLFHPCNNNKTTTKKHASKQQQQQQILQNGSFSRSLVLALVLARSLSERAVQKNKRGFWDFTKSKTQTTTKKRVCVLHGS